jgi:hypothetical protein
VLAASDWPAWAAFGIAALALGWQVATHFLGREDRRRREQEIHALRQAQTEALLRIAEGQSGSAVERDHAEGAQLSASFGSTRRANDRLVVSNMGPGGAQLRSVEVLSANFPQLRTGLEGGPIDLLPGEEHRMPAALAMQTERPVRVLVRWIDSRGEQEREQLINPQ